MKLLWTINFTALLNIAICSNLNTTCYLSDNKVWTCDNIPLDIPYGTTSVHIKDFMYEAVVFEINYTRFQSESWKHVTHLKFSDVYSGYNNNITFRDSAFRDLHNLEVLEIHSQGEIQLEHFALFGLTNVTILDFSRCERLKLEDIAAALNGSDKVPNLTQLLLSHINYIWSPFKIDRSFSRCLSQKPLFYLDLSRTRISAIEFNILKDLNNLTIFNISEAIISEITLDDVTPNDLKYIYIFDISHVIVSKYSYFLYHSLSNANITFEDHGQYLGFLLSPEILNINGIVVGITEVMFYKCKFRSFTYFKSLTKELIMMENKIRRVDIEFVCDNFDLTSIKLLEFAKNGLEFVHPSIFNCMSNLEHLDLSVNNLYEMYVENIQMFTQLLKSLENLKYIHLASNYFTEIPEEFFDGNANLELINLAGNRLTQVHFKLHNLRKLQFLNLVENRIKIIDDISMDYLDSLRPTAQYNVGENTDINVTLNENYNYGKTTFDIRLNPLMCDGCETLHSVRWVLKTKYLGTLSENITCKSETGIQVHLNEQAVTMVKTICYKKTRNIVIITITALISVLCTGIAFMVYIRRRNRRRLAKRNDIINMLKVDEGRFFVFVSYNNEDEDFVTENVIEPLNEGLQRIIDTDRNLVCRGDIEFRPGQQLHDELIRCIEQCTVFLSVISNQYCNSDFCKEEFNQAIRMKTPVLLMIKDEVDVGMMTPSMKLLFRNNVRILWENNDGEYRLKTSWENVCASILNLAAN